MSILQNIDFKTLAREQKSARIKLRFLALQHFQDGHSRTDIASFLKVSRTSVNKWVSDYLANGIEGLMDKKQPGRPAILSESQLQQLARYIEHSSLNVKGGRLMGTDIQVYIKEHFDIDYHRMTIYKILKKLGFSWITSRSKHPKQSEEAQTAFKKIQNKNDP